MKKTLTILGFLAVVRAGAALADDDCFVPMADWQPREAVARLAEENHALREAATMWIGLYEKQLKRANDATPPSSLPTELSRR